MGKSVPNDASPLSPTPHRGADVTLPLSPNDVRAAEFIGRYRVETILGHGGFAVVYRAHDDELNRRVAIKVPRPELVDRPEAAEQYLAEARTLAGLDHPHIVPVYDVGKSDGRPCYIVSKFIEGSTLTARLA